MNESDLLVRPAIFIVYLRFIHSVLIIPQLHVVRKCAFGAERLKQSPYRSDVAGSDKAP